MIRFEDCVECSFDLDPSKIGPYYNCNACSNCEEGIKFYFAGKIMRDSDPNKSILSNEVREHFKEYYGGISNCGTIAVLPHKPKSKDKFPNRFEMIWFIIVSIAWNSLIIYILLMI